MRRAPLFLLILCAACAEERALVAELSVAEEVTGDRLCVTAFGNGERVFARSYREGASPRQGSLAFIAGDRIDDRLRVTGSVDRGGREVARGTAESSFGTLDSVRLPVEVRPCRRRPMALSRAELHEVASDPAWAGDRRPLLGADVDGDGRDELLLVDGGGTAVAIDLEPGAGTARPLRMTVPAGAHVGASAGLDDDCVPDLVTIGPEGSMHLSANDAWSRAQTLEGSPRAVGIGNLRGAAQPVLAWTTEGGLYTLEWPSETTASLAEGAWRDVALADFTGDGIDDLVASGAGGARLWLGTEDGPRAVDAALPVAFSEVTGPIGAGDLDGDGHADVVGAAATSVRIAINRGDGLLEDRSGAMPPALAAPAVALVLVDIDGDCRQDVAILDEEGTIQLILLGEALALDVVMLTEPVAAGIAAGDANGDGYRELFLLSREGEVYTWGG